MADCAVTCENLSVEIAGRPVLSDINVSISHGELVLVFGPNGAGKTCFLRTLVGDLKPVTGKVEVFGKRAEKQLREIGYVPQAIAPRGAFPIRVEKVVMMGRLGRIGLFRPPRGVDRDICHAALAQVGLGGFGSAYLDDLSGGQRQRVYIARALAGEPKLLLLDEATSGVDIGVKESLMELLERLKQQLTIIFVTHDVSVVSTAVDQILCLNRTLVSHGKPAEALTADAMKCMYGENAALFSHCDLPHMHVHKHDHRD